MTHLTSTSVPSRFTGSITALITPFLDGEVDTRALLGLVEFQIAGDTSDLVPGGTTVETATRTLAEQDLVISTVVSQANGRLPVFAGTGTNGTRTNGTGTNGTGTTSECTQRAQALGADAALIVTPYYNKPTQIGLYDHYATVAASTALPIILYNVPGRTGVNMAPETILRLAAIPNIIGVKEASGSLDQATQIVNEAHAGFILLSGDDSLTLPITGVSGHGVISVVSNIAPASVAKLTRACLAGDFAPARSLHFNLFDLCRVMFCETDLVSVKAAAALLGLCTADIRQPLAPVSEASAHRVAAALTACPYTGVTIDATMVAA